MFRVVTILLLILPFAAAGGGWTYTTTDTTCKNPLKVTGTLSVSNECTCDTVPVAENLRKLLKKHLAPKYYTPDNTPIKVGQDLELLDGSKIPGSAIADIQDLWDALSTMNIEDDVTIEVPCQSGLTMTGTLYLTGFTSRRINIIGKPLVASDYCKIFYQMEYTDSIEVASADVTDMRAAIVVNNGANVGFHNFHIEEDGDNDLLTIGLWIEDGARVYTVPEVKEYNRGFKSKFDRYTRTPTPTPTPRNGAPSAPVTPTGPVTHYSLKFEKFFAGIFTSNYGMFRGARRNGKGGLSCRFVHTCVAAERLALAEVDSAVMDGAYTGKIKAAGILARGNSLVLADGARLSGFWTGVMAREGSGVRVQEAIFDGFNTPPTPGDDDLVPYKMDYAVRAGEASYVVAHRAAALDIATQSVVVSSNAAFVANDFDSITEQVPYDRDTQNCVSVDSNGAAIVRGMFCKGASASAFNATNGGTILADNITAIMREGEEPNVPIQCFFASSGRVAGGGHCHSNGTSYMRGAVLTSGSVGLLDDLYVKSQSECFKVKYSSHLGARSAGAGVTCSTTVLNTNAVDASHDSSVNMNNLEFIPRNAATLPAGSIPCFNNYQSSTQHYSKVQVTGTTAAGVGAVTCDHTSLWETDHSAAGPYELCL